MPDPTGPGAQRLPAPAIRKILVIQLCPLGDTLFGTPAIRALRRRFPGAHIADLTWSSNREILEGNPHLDRLITCPGPLKLPRILSELVEEDFDAVVALSHVGSWLTLFTGASVRAGFNSQTLGWSYTVRVPDRRERHAVDYCLDVVAALGAEPDGRTMDLPLPDEHRRWAHETLARHRSRPPLRVAIHPGGRHFQAKRWPAEGFAYVADYLEGQYGAQVILVGGRDDVGLAHAIVQATRLAQPLVVAGQAGIKQTAAILQQSDLFIGNDSAPMHMAVAVGTPVVALFGPTNPDNFRPLGPLDVVVRRPPACSPCFHWLDGSRQHFPALCQINGAAECMRAITPRDVLAAVEWQLDRLHLRALRSLGRPPSLPPHGWPPEAMVALAPSRLRWGRRERPHPWRRRRLLGVRRMPAPHEIREFEEQ
ncbi:MAG: glycosyltransferase family 9 protein [Limnochordaceae bacterium]|nr:glycosyltransferase family 9 protein [Limnochordaceae bacterium]